MAGDGRVDEDVTRVERLPALVVCARRIDDDAGHASPRTSAVACLLTVPSPSPRGIGCPLWGSGPLTRVGTDWHAATVKVDETEGALAMAVHARPLDRPPTRPPRALGRRSSCRSRIRRRLAPVTAWRRRTVSCSPARIRRRRRETRRPRVAPGSGSCRRGSVAHAASTGRADHLRAPRSCAHQNLGTLALARAARVASSGSRPGVHRLGRTSTRRSSRRIVRSSSARPVPSSTVSTGTCTPSAVRRRAWS